MVERKAVKGKALTNAILDSSLDAIVLIDPSGKILEYSRGAERVFAYKKEEALGKQMQEYLIPKNDKAKYDRWLSRFSETGKSIILGKRIELQGVRPDGTSFPIDISISPIKTVSGPCLACFIRDITQKKKYEYELKRNWKRYRDLYNETPVMMHSLSAEGKIISVNDYWVKKFGYSRYEALTMSFIELYHPEDSHIGIKNFEELKEGGDFRDRRVELTRKDGKRMNVLLSSNLDQDEYSGRIIYHTVMRDITDQVETERSLIEKSLQLVEKDQLERLNGDLQRANRELREFAHVVSHDLKAPLRGIGNLTNWLQTDYREKFDDEGRNKLDLLISRAQWMEKLIEDILEYSKVGLKDALKEDLDLNQLLEDVVLMINKPPNCEIITEGELPFLHCFKTNWSQIFQNLINNAIEHNDKEQMRIFVGSQKTDLGYLFWVRDNGPGIDDRHKERVFKIFLTLKGKYAYNRTGIGLSIVKKIVELHEGEIWLESEVGRGTTFYFTYPTTDDNC